MVRERSKTADARHPQTTEMRRFYETSDAYFDMLSDASSASHKNELELYTRIIKRYVENGKPLLDLGCGRGISTGLLADPSYYIVGVDLSVRLLRGRPDSISDAGWIAASAEHLPFHDKTFAVVGMNSVLEHVTDVPAVLEELTRVVAPGGRIVIVSPNLLTPIRPLKAILGKDMVSMGFYRSRIGAFLSIFGNILRLAKKRLIPSPEFIYRKPNLENFGGPDDDATYFCNSIDVIRWFRRRGLHASRVPFPVTRMNGISRLKARLAFMLPDLDKGFCIVAERR